jgi:formylglycine-generating enzyme required for sulfatase activity
LFFVSGLLLVALALEMVAITAGEYRPLYMREDSELIRVDDFLIDETPVSNLDYYRFTQAANDWRKGAIPDLFSEPNYLAHWSQIEGVWQPAAAQNHQAVVNVSWFAANAYCKKQGKRLPTVAEWEYVASASETSPDGSQDEDYNQRILDWYAKPASHGTIGKRPANYWGVKDLHGLNWEWTLDFNSILTSGESRADASVNTDLYCAAAASGSADPSDYAAFMRYGFRSSLSATFAINNLGFRCASDISKEDSE